jgi:hypothetical protein
MTVRLEMSNKTTFGSGEVFVYNRCKRLGYTRNEMDALAWHVEHFYLDSYNYPNAFNLRIARKFVTKELHPYFDQASNYRRNSLYESTVFTHGGEFYFGFHYDNP